MTIMMIVTKVMMIMMTKIMMVIRMIVTLCCQCCPLVTVWLSVNSRAALVNMLACDVTCCALKL